MRIDETTPKAYIMSMIKERILPQIKYEIDLQNPHTLIALIQAARVAERAMHSCNDSFTNIMKNYELEKVIKQLEQKVNILTILQNFAIIVNDQITP